MTIATLVKITPARKLMMKISEKTYDMISTRLTAECKKKGFSTDRLATFSLENDDGEENYFVMISLDRYDKQNMRKFEVLLKRDVAIQYRMKPYDFIPDGEDEQRCGINLELISIRQVKPRVDEVDKMVAARMSQSAAKLNAEEQAVDEIVEKAVAELPSPPKLERQNAVAAPRRRRAAPVAVTALEAQMKALEEADE